MPQDLFGHRFVLGVAGLILNEQAMFARKPRSHYTGATCLDLAAGSRLVQIPVESRLESPRLIENVGLSFAVDYVSNLWTNKTQNFCDDTFVRKRKGRKNPYTVESMIMELVHHRYRGSRKHEGGTSNAVLGIRERRAVPKGLIRAARA